jgi:hypothetical protein
MEALLKSAVVTLDAPLLVDGSGSEPTAGEPFLADQPQPASPAGRLSALVLPSKSTAAHAAVILVGPRVAAGSGAGPVPSAPRWRLLSSGLLL